MLCVLPDSIRFRNFHLISQHLSPNSPNNSLDFVVPWGIYPWTNCGIPFVEGAGHFRVEDAVVVNDDCLDELVDAVLILHLIPLGWYRHQRGTEANGQVVGVHHVVVGHFSKAKGEELGNMSLAAKQKVHTWVLDNNQTPLTRYQNYAFFCNDNIHLRAAKLVKIWDRWYK